MIALISAKLGYWVFIVLMLMGLHAMIVRRNLVRKLIGLTIFQSSIILFFITMSAKRDGHVPIVDGYRVPGTLREEEILHNPLPHVLMLTAIVVGVSVLGVALAIVLRIHARYQSLEEDEIFDRIDT